MPSDNEVFAKSEYTFTFMTFDYVLLNLYSNFLLTVFALYELFDIFRMASNWDNLIEVISSSKIYLPKLDKSTSVQTVFFVNSLETIHP